MTNPLVEPQDHVIIHALIILVCSAAICLIPVGVVHADSAKDIAQDQHMVYIDKAIQDLQDGRKEMREKRDQQILDLTAAIAASNARQAEDEGLFRGALGAIGVLQTFGLIKSWKASNRGN
jgi:hypothetical protein